ncbi:MAG: DNA replication/repair protein RecF [Bacteroidetes bacterium]|jgi:DNA replication and repair protein RecF|nr:DNA replication/repair protein RecF [Bacteroidota bacterium]
MHLTSLTLLNFKNYEHFEGNFSLKINCFVGQNGIGKTNLLDAIYYLAFCKSYFNSIDSQNIKHNESFFMIQGFFEKNLDKIELQCSVKKHQKKLFKRNQVEYDKLSDHIGFIPLIMISPSDNELIYGSSELRRKFIDGIISQYDKVYLDNLVQYNHVLKQRNALLKNFFEQNYFDNETLEIWTEQLIIYGEKIIKIRKLFLEEFIELFNKNYEFISSQKEHVSLNYLNSINDDFKAELNNYLNRDRLSHNTTIGPHKDDLEFCISGYSLKKFASQGQQKSFLLALKLAQYEFIKHKKQVKPLLLLDDIYDKLDEARFNKLIDLVGNNYFGQVFITDAHPERISKLMSSKNIESKLFNIES